jgi:hypothetical protein
MYTTSLSWRGRKGEMPFEDECGSHEKVVQGQRARKRRREGLKGTKKRADIVTRLSDEFVRLD